MAINGFGRIGRTIMRIAKLRGHYDVVAVNDLASLEQLADAFKYDNTHGIFPSEVCANGDRMEINGDPFSVLSERGPAKPPWRELGVYYVIESSGVFRHIADLEKHLAAGARRVLLTVPSKDALPATLVTGVNDEVVNIDIRIISNASCTTNCAASLAKVLNDSFACAEGC